jgi:hypothetical protein
MMMGGVDMKTPEAGAGGEAKGAEEGEEEKVPVPSLYFIDYMASMQKCDFGAHGYGGYFIYSTFDRYWKKDMTQDEAMELAKKVRVTEAKEAQEAQEAKEAPDAQWRVCHICGVWYVGCGCGCVLGGVR